MYSNSAASFTSQLKAMLRRNITLKKRQKRRTFMELFLPMYFLCLLVMIRGLVPNYQLPAEDKFRGGTNLFESYSNKNHTVAVVPDTNDTRYFMNELNKIWRFNIIERKKNHIRQLNLNEPIEFIFYKNTDELQDALWMNTSSFEIAVIFKTEEPTNGSLKYELRANPMFGESPSTAELFSSPMSCRIPPNMTKEIPTILANSCPAYLYYSSGFVGLQMLIDYTKMKIDSGPKGKDISLPSIKLEQFPKPAFTAEYNPIQNQGINIGILDHYGSSHISNSLNDNTFRAAFTFCLVVELSQIITYLLALIVGEKETKIKEGMKMMGLRDSVYWISWFIIYAILVLILSIITTCVLYSLQVFQHSSYILIFLLILLFSLSIIMMAFMMTPFFDKARTAGIIGNFVVNLLSLLYFVTVVMEDSSSFVIYLLSLSSSSGFVIAFNKALVLDLSGDGVTFSNLWSGHGITFGGSLIMMTVDTVLYGFLAFYLDSVIPSEYGTKRSPGFIFSSAFWFPAKNKVQTLTEEPTTEVESPDIESPSKDMKGKEAIEIIDLCKSFTSCCKPEVKAIDGFSLKIYEGQITALLGHNGAGKTSVFNILTGLTTPTAGTIRIYGHDVRDQNGINSIHQMTGVCPQHDILFQLLSPREHLEFFAAVRGVPPSQLDIEVTKTLKDIGMEESADVLSKYLSGGQRRKLSVGIAIIGDPKIIILDEPTAAVDPISRRHLWSILQNKKQDRVILLTTHYMDEADFLADRKAVISKGRLRCCGSSLFLKNKFGVGYRLTLVLGNTAQDTTSEIGKLVTRFVPKAENSRRYGSEISFMLPHDSVESFASLFSTLETEISSQEQCLNITSYGVSMTTLEEVFYQLEKSEGEEIETTNLSRKNSLKKLLKKSTSKLQNESHLKLLNDNEAELDSSMTGVSFEMEEDVPNKVEPFSLEPVVSTPSSFQMFKVILKLRMFRLLRDYKLLYSMIVFPLIFSVIGLLFIRNKIIQPKMESLVLNKDTYSKGNVVAFHNDTLHSVDKFIPNLRRDVKIDWYDGHFKSLLNMTSRIHLAAINIEQCCDTSNLSLTVLYNDTEIHSLPIIINSINNAVYRMAQAEKKKSLQNRITVSTYPFQKNTRSGKLDSTSFSLSYFLGMTLALAPISLAIDIVHDRQIKAKNLLRVNGLTFSVYFGSFFIIFSIIMFLIAGGLLGLLYFFKLPFVSEHASLFPLTLILSLYCPSSLIFTTCLSFAFENSESAQSFLPNIATFLGLLPFLLVALLNMLEHVASFVLHMILSLIDPIYTPYAVFFYINQVQSMCKVNADSSCPSLTISDYMTKENVAMIIGGICQIPLYLFVLLYLDIRQCGGGFSDLLHKVCKIDPKPKILKESGALNDVIANEDSDVTAERERVDRWLSEDVTTDHPVILVQNLRKEYKSSKVFKLSDLVCKKEDELEPTKVAIKNLSFAVESGEIFGLLGHNGAGKTSTIKVIIAEEIATRGKIQINGINITSGISDAFHYVGYCPQSDAQWNNITLREHLELYAFIRGVPPSQLQRVVDSYLTGLQIQEHADKHSDQCSGGTKRKLSFAMSMIASPCIVIMDEPSCGMDPYSKRFLWNTIVANFQGRRGAILTTHCMDEADILCTRVGIMVKGELRCIGSTQHLKNQFGAGYSLEIKLHCPKGEDLASLIARQNALKSFVDRLFSDATVESDFIGRLIYSVPQHAVKSLSECFTHLEQAKNEFNIEEYSFSQTTLDQVFLKFALYDDGD